MGALYTEMYKLTIEKYSISFSNCMQTVCKYTVLNADFDIAQVERYTSANRKKKSKCSLEWKKKCRKQDLI